MKLLETKSTKSEKPPDIEDLPIGTVFKDKEGDIFLRTEDGIVTLVGLFHLKTGSTFVKVQYDSFVVAEIYPNATLSLDGEIKGPENQS